MLQKIQKSGFIPKLLGGFTVGLGVLIAGVVQAAVINGGTKLGAGIADNLLFESSTTFNGSANQFATLAVGTQGVGGVTFFNGTIINNTVNDDAEDNPVAFGDNVRIDGRIWRGTSAGPEDDGSMPVIVNDNAQILGGLTVSDSLTVDGDEVSAGTLANTDVAETVTADWINTANPWSSSEIANITNEINLPLLSFYNVDGTNAGSIGTTSASTQPVLASSQEGLFSIRWASSDTDPIGAEFTIPTDYASGGVFKANIKLPASPTGDNDLAGKTFVIGDTESTSTITFTSTTGGTNYDTGLSGNKITTVTFTPGTGVTFSAGDHVSFTLERAGGSDTIELMSTEFEYTAVQ